MIDENIGKEMADCFDKMLDKLDKPIIEHPDVQRLIGQVVELQAEKKALIQERTNTEYWVNYHNLSVINLLIKSDHKRMTEAIEHITECCVDQKSGAMSDALDEILATANTVLKNRKFIEKLSPSGA